MAVSILFCKSVCVFFVCFIFDGFISAQMNNQLPNEGQDSSYFFYQRPEYPRDCSEAFASCSSSVSSGVYLIKPDGYAEPFEVYCDHSDVDSRDWTVFLRRLDGSVDFNRSWSEYKRGFGFLSSEFWLGNEKLSFITNQAVYELRIDITLENDTTCDVGYDAFRISDEWSNYAITTVGTYESDQACKLEGGDSSTPEECNPTYDSANFTNCNDVYNAGCIQDGVYSIRPTGWNGPAFNVFCNMSIDGGNWTVFQRRIDGSTDFYRNWTEYREGFGNIQHEFWLGNEKLYYLTQQANYEYRLDFVRSSGDSHNNKFSIFRIDNEANNYQVTDVGIRFSYSSGYSLNNVHHRNFSTYDQDNDGRAHNCAEGHRSGWWHGGSYNTYTSSPCFNFRSGSTHVQCSYANLNGDYDGGNGQNIFDRYYNACNQTYTEIKIRRIS